MKSKIFILEYQDCKKFKIHRPKVKKCKKWEILIKKYRIININVLPIKISVEKNFNDERLFLILINNVIDEMNNHNYFKSSSEFNQFKLLVYFQNS